MKKNTKLEKYLFQVICILSIIVITYFDANYKTSISIVYLGTTHLFWSIDQTFKHKAKDIFYPILSYK